jgi:hypothetical protein
MPSRCWNGVVREVPCVLRTCSTKRHLKRDDEGCAQREGGRLGWHWGRARVTSCCGAWSKPTWNECGVCAIDVHGVAWSPRFWACAGLCGKGCGARLRAGGCRGGVRWCAGSTMPKGLAWSGWTRCWIKSPSRFCIGLLASSLQTLSNKRGQCYSVVRPKGRGACWSGLCVDLVVIKNNIA